MKYTGISTFGSVCFCLLFVAGCGGSPKVERGAETGLRPAERGQARREFNTQRAGRSDPSRRGEARPVSDAEGVVTRWFRRRVTGRAASSRARAQFASGGSARRSSSLSSTGSRATKSDDFPFEAEAARGAKKPARTINIEGFRSPVSRADDNETELAGEDLAEEEPREAEAPDDMEVYEDDHEKGADEDLESILEDLESEE